MVTPTEQLAREEVFGALKRNCGWMLALGIVMVALGMMGLGMVGAMTVLSVLYFGFMLLFGSGIQLVQAFQADGWSGRIWQIVIALLYLGAGIVVISDPVLASATLTLALACCFVAVGVVRIIMALRLRGGQGWVWTLIAGIAAIVLGVMILNRWPVDSLWVIGVLVSIELIFAGWSQIAIAVAARKLLQADALPPAAGA